MCSSDLTIQKAMLLLERAGFIESRGRAGTFVSEHPPHLSRYALVFSGASQDGQDDSPHFRFWRVLASQARALVLPPACAIESYWGIDSHVDTEDYQSLGREVKSHRLAGLIFVDPLHSQESPLMECDLPKVGIFSQIGRAHV